MGMTMRLTIKTKLASAFGAVILLSAITAGIGYMKLSDTVSTTEQIVAAAGRMDKGSTLKEFILLQIRAEKNALLENTEADQNRFIAEAATNRAAFTKARDEIDANAAEAGKKILDRVATAQANADALEDQTFKLLKSDRAKAIELSSGDERKAVADTLAVLDEFTTFVKKLMADKSDAAS